MSTGASTSSDPMRVQEWCDQYGLLRPLTPFAYRETDVIELAAEINQNLSDIANTAALFRLRDVSEQATTNARLINPILLAQGAWPYPDDRGEVCRWVNPTYHHPGHVANLDDDQRVEHARTCVRFGTIELADIAPRFGVTPQTLGQWLDRHGMDWAAERREGRRRLARTLRTAVAWGYDFERVASIWPQPESTIRRWVSRYATSEGFEPPADPSTDPSFGQGVLPDAE